MQALSIDQLAGQTVGNYRIERFLGRGRLNAIYLARNLAEEQQLDALTVYRVPEHFSSEARMRFLSRFQKEASIITSLEHPHILPVYDHGEVAGNPYLVTPYMMQGSLADLLKRHGKYNSSSILPILEQLVSGVAYAHGRGFIHGTLRPSTIVLSSEDTLRVAGFGLMHMLQLAGIEPDIQLKAPYACLLSVAETFLVTPEYVAPEVVQGQPIDIRSDIYALGCILFELLSGHPPFTGKDPLDVINKHVRDAVPLLHVDNPDVPIALTSVVNQALERDPARRFRNVLELIEAFRQASRGAINYSVSETVRKTKALKTNESVRDDALHNVYSSGKWQLVPPIVTGKHSSVRLSAQTLLAEMSNQSINTGPRRAVRSTSTEKSLMIPSGKVPSLLPSAPQEAKPSIVPERKVVEEMPKESLSTDSWRAVQSSAVEPPLPMTKSGEVPPVSISASQQVDSSVASKEPSSEGSKGEDLSSLADAYSWWSMPGIASPSELQTKRTPPKSPETTRESLRLADPDTVEWQNDSSDPLALSPTSAPASNSASRKKVNRRRVVALLGTSSVAVAVAAVALNPGTLQALGIKSMFDIMPKDKEISKPSGPAEVPVQTPKTKDNTNVDMIIGHTTMAVNSASSFKNPADGQESLLIHLPDKEFVAYERTCTHRQVFVNYDPITKLLICPAHGAIFDPAHGGRVMQGPATQPLPSVKISVKSDGAIMAG